MHPYSSLFNGEINLKSTTTCRASSSVFLIALVD